MMERVIAMTEQAARNIAELLGTSYKKVDEDFVVDVPEKYEKEVENILCDNECAFHDIQNSKITLDERNTALMNALQRVQMAEHRHSGICGEVRVQLDQHFKVDTIYDNAEYVLDCLQMLRNMIGKWLVLQDCEPDAHAVNYPIEGTRYRFLAAKDAGLLWADKRRIELLGWLVKEFTDEPVFVWPDNEWTLRTEYSAEVFGYKGDDYQTIKHPVYDERGELLL